ncbi:MAG: CRISPR-associated endonuclease Cas1 [Cyanobacteriota bacterium]
MTIIPQERLIIAQKIVEANMKSTYGCYTPLKSPQPPAILGGKGGCLRLGLQPTVCSIHSSISYKLKNSRVLLMRQYRTRQKESLDLAIKSLNYFAEKTLTVNRIEQLFGIEGTGAAHYFQALGDCIAYEEFKLLARSRRPPKNPTNSLLSFGYQVLWNHLLTLLELQGLDPYYACLHQGSERHAALASDLIEEFRVPLVDSFVLWLINSRILHINYDFRYQNGGCFLNQQGRKKFLTYWLKRMEEKMGSEDQPRWDILIPL